MTSSALLPNPAHTLHSRTLAEDVVVAILDTGVDPSPLLYTPSGNRRLIDLVDCTGSGDIDLSHSTKSKQGHLQGLSGRTLKLPSVENDSDTWYLGLLYAYRVFPSALVKRMKKERKTQWEKHIRQALNQIRGKDGPEWEARRAILRAADKSYKDVGPVYDVVVWNSSNNDGLKAIVDTGAKGCLEEEVVLDDFEKHGKFATFAHGLMLNFAVKIWNDRISVIVDGGSHGTHVAGIISGIAPEASLISLKIGDGRLNSMETHQGLMRALGYLISRCEKGKKVHVVNMSFGEHTRDSNRGRFIRLVEKLVYEHHAVFMSSAGNDGPALGSVSAPGGTTEAMIGVGAFVTTEMLLQAYSQLGSEFGGVGGVSYTWTARGPTNDGARGVDICAPGGAVAEVPNWTVRKKMLMNGTSMASPCAAGVVALLIGGLKRIGVEYTGELIRRAVENSAGQVKMNAGVADVFATGMGCIDGESAWKYLERYVERKKEGKWDWLEEWRVKVSVEDGNVARRGNNGCGTLNANRGIYLRGTTDCNHVQRALVSIEVVGKEGCEVSKQELMGLEVMLKLECHAEWVEVTERVLLLGGGRSFPVVVNPLGLESGRSHFTEIRVRVEGGGVLCRIPITVLKPEALTGNAIIPWRDIGFSAGSVVRRFYEAPMGTTYGILKIVAGSLTERETGGECSVSEVSSRPISPGREVKSGAGGGGSHGGVTGGGTDARNFEAHIVQLSPQKHCGEMESRHYLTLRPGMVKEVVVKIKGGGCVELCIAQMWLSAGKSVIERVELTFGGITPNPNVVVGMGGWFPRVEVGNLGGGGEGVCGFSARGVMTHLRKIWNVSKSKVVGLEEREGVEGWELQLEYGFEMYESGSVRILFSGVNGVVYESEVGGGPFVIVYDKNGQVMFVSDIYPGEYSLQKGEYVAKGYLRHEDVEVLDGLKELKMMTEYDIGCEGGLEVYESQHGAITSREDRKLSKSVISLEVGERRAFYFGTPKKSWIPKWASNGDLMVGKMNVDRIVGGSGKRGDVPSYDIFMVVGGEERGGSGGGGGGESGNQKNGNKEKKKEEESVEQAINKLKLRKLKGMMKEGKSEEFEKLYKQVQVGTEHKMLKLELLDNKLCKEWKKEEMDINLFDSMATQVGELCDQVIGESDIGAIASHFGMMVDTESTEEMNERKRFEIKRGQVIEALFRKARMEVMKGLNKKNKEEEVETDVGECEKVMKQLGRWIGLDVKGACSIPTGCGISGEEFVMVLARKEVLKDRVGSGLKLLNEYFGGSGSKRNESKQVLMFREECLGKLGWEFMVEREVCNRLVRFPPVQSLY